MNALWQSLHFLRPQWLWALLALPLLWGLWRLRRRRAEVWRGLVDAHLLPYLLESAGKATRATFAWIALAWLLAVLALAGPSWRQDEQPLWQSRAPLAIALDLSSRTGAADLPPSRLLQARAKLATLLREREGGQVALLAYAGDVFTVAPLTDDGGNVALFLDALEPAVMPVDGQDAGRAIDAAARLLRQAGFTEGDILLLTDRADAAAESAAAAAARQGFRVSVLGLGTPAGAAYRDAEGRIGRASLDAASLRALAGAGGGRYAPLASGDGDLHALGVLASQQADAASARGEKRLSWRDDGYWLLPPLMLLALFAFRRGGVAAVLLLCLALPLPRPAQAAERAWWQRPDQQQQVRIEQGVQAYRSGDYQGAEQAFAGIDSADAYYNHGNALARQGRYDEAIAAYDEALKRQPQMEDAIANRQAVDEARKRQDRDGQNQDNGSGKGGGQSGQSGQDPQRKDAQNGNDASSPQDPEGGGSSSQQKGKADDAPSKRDGQPQAPSDAQPRQPEDAQTQQAADAAQRERMRQAMEKAQQDGRTETDGKAAVAEESAADRERRQAVEAWLRRVPDDPGGLLRTKFRLEYERRQREGR